MNRKNITIVIVAILILIMISSLSFFAYKINKDKVDNQNVINIDDKSSTTSTTTSTSTTSTTTTTITTTTVVTTTKSSNKKNNNKSNSNSSNESSTTVPDEVKGDDVYPSPTDEETVGDFEVGDSTQKWNSETKLKIFDVTEVSPGDNGKYEFYVNNNTNKFVMYTIKFDEINEYNANLVYKLLRNGSYVSGDENTYVKYNEVIIPEKELNRNEKDNFTIYWKWVDSPSDAYVGRAAALHDATYTLKVTVNSMEVAGEDRYNPITGDTIIKYIVLSIISITGIITLIIVFKKRDKHEDN